MVIYRSATFDDVEKLHKLLNDYACLLYTSDAADE